MRVSRAFDMLVLSTSLMVLLTGSAIYSQTPWNRLKAEVTDPIYTTYAADRERSEYLVDEGYHLVFYLDNEPIKFTTDTAGELSIAWKLGGQLVVYLKDMHQSPVITRSYHDLVQLEFYPFTTIRVRETFLVYSSRMTLPEVEITNISPREEAMTVCPFFARPKEGVAEAKLLEDKRRAIFFHREPPEQWFQTPLPEYQSRFRNIYLLSEKADSWGGYLKGVEELFENIKKSDTLIGTLEESLASFAFQKNIILPPGGSTKLRLIRGVQPASEPED